MLDRVLSRIRNRRRRELYDRPVVAVIDRVPPTTCSFREPPTKSTPSLSLLYWLGRQWAWPAVEFRCRTHPHEITSECDAAGHTVLHWVLMGHPPLKVVQALLEGCPLLTGYCNDDGHLPLHIACAYRASTDVLLALIQADPMSVGEPTTDGSFALHLLANVGCEPAAMDAVLSQSASIPTLGERDGMFGQTPLALLNARKNLHQFQSNLERLRHVRKRGLLDETPVWIESLQSDTFWCKAVLLVVAEYLGRPLCPQENVAPALILQAFISIANVCPPSLTEMAIWLYHDELLTCDGDGNVPLHNVAAETTSAALLLEVLEAQPAAARVRNDECRLPFELAVVNPCLSWSSGLATMLQAHPPALMSVPVNQVLYPYIWEHLASPSALFVVVRGHAGLL